MPPQQCSLSMPFGRCSGAAGVLSRRGCQRRLTRQVNTDRPLTSASFMCTFSSSSSSSLRPVTRPCSSSSSSPWSLSVRMTESPASKAPAPCVTYKTSQDVPKQEHEGHTIGGGEEEKGVTITTSSAGREKAPQLSTIG